MLRGDFRASLSPLKGNRMQSQKAHLIAFRHQRAIFVFVVLGLIILFSTAVLWGHYETVITRYQWLAKAGLALVDVIAVGLAIWHLYTHHAPLKVWCYIADGVIAAMMIVHAGAVLQLDSSTARQIAQVKAAAEAQAKLREADAQVEAAKIKAAGEAAAAVKRTTGSTTLASRTLRTAETKQDGRAAEALTKMAAEVKPQTFLSDEYMRGGVYYWPALIALLFFFVAIGISAFSLPVEDPELDAPDEDSGVEARRFFRSASKVQPGFSPRFAPAMKRQDDGAAAPVRTKEEEFDDAPKDPRRWN
jgi:hypothetical protein